MQLQRRNAAHLRLCSKAEESHATLLPRRECACHSRIPFRFTAHPSPHRPAPHPPRAMRAASSPQGERSLDRCGALFSSPLGERVARRFSGEPGEGDARQILSPGLRPRGMREMARRKSQILWLRLRRRKRQAPFGAPHALFSVRYRASRYLSADRGRPQIKRMSLAAFSDGRPRFPMRVSSQRSFRPVWGPPLSGLTLSRGGDRLALVWTSRSSASSWQGLLVDPGGAPPPPECRNAKPDPRGAAPRPAVQRLAMAPLSGRGVRSLREAFGGGIRR